MSRENRDCVVCYETKKDFWKCENCGKETCVVCYARIISMTNVPYGERCPMCRADIEEPVDVREPWFYIPDKHLMNCFRKTKPIPIEIVDRQLRLKSGKRGMAYSI